MLVSVYFLSKGFDAPGWGNIRVMENKMETTIMRYWGNIRIMETKMETTIMGLCKGISQSVRGRGS